MDSKKEFIPDLIKESEALINSNKIIEARETLVRMLTAYDHENIKHEAIQVHSDLLNGERNLHLCRRCDWTR